MRGGTSHNPQRHGAQLAEAHSCWRTAVPGQPTLQPQVLKENVCPHRVLGVFIAVMIQSLLVGLGKGVPGLEQRYAAND